MYTYIASIQTKVASKAHCNALSPKVGAIFSSCIKINGAGNAQSFRESTSSFALSIVKFQSI